MRVGSRYPMLLQSCALLLGLLPGALATDILSTDGFSTCGGSTDITVQKLNIEYDRSTKKVTFDVAGTSAKEQKVMATLLVTAYGKEVYKRSFDPCDEGITQLCPIPSGTFAAAGSQDIPEEYASQIPSIAFTIPDLDGQAKLELTSKDSNDTVACIESTVNNGKSFSVPSVSYVAAGIAASALVLTGLSAAGAAGQPGIGTPSPTFGEVIGYFQGIAMNGMLSVNYPTVYRSFSRNFGFSGLLIPWGAMQTSIDDFRAATGGNLTSDSYALLKNTTLVYESSSSKRKRALEDFVLFTRDLTTSVNSTTSDNSTSDDNKIMKIVHGIQGYVEEFSIPKTNTFMVVLLVFAVIIAAIIVGVLLLKVILETWALFGSFPQRLTNFRKRYWFLIAKTITNLILLLYGIWVLWCVYQLKMADAWAPRVLAGATLALFTAVLGFFIFRIWYLARKYKKSEGDASGLYDDKETWRKYSLFYENYKKNYWWLFVPAIVYMLAKGCVIAGADGKGLVQSAGQLIIEALLLILLLWSRPYSLKSSNWINIVIQVVRVLSVVCILVFVEELGVAQTTKTITGVVLIVMQSVLTAVLAILIAVNSIIICCKENPHKRKRKEAEKLNRDLDNLTPLDARNSLLMDTTNLDNKRTSRFGRQGYDPVPPTDTAYYGRAESTADLTSKRGLLDDAAGMGHGHIEMRSVSSETGRHQQYQQDHQYQPAPQYQQTAPTLPSLDLGTDVERAQQRGYTRF